MGAKIIMEKIFDRNSTVKEAKNYKPFAEAVEHIEWGKDEEDTLEEIARRVSPSWNPDDMAYGLNRLAELCYNDTEVLQQFYTDEEKMKIRKRKIQHYFGFQQGKRLLLRFQSREAVIMEYAV